MSQKESEKKLASSSSSELVILEDTEQLDQCELEVSETNYEELDHSQPVTTLLKLTDGKAISQSQNLAESCSCMVEAVYLATYKKLQIEMCLRLGKLVKKSKA